MDINYYFLKNSSILDLDFEYFLISFKIQSSYSQEDIEILVLKKPRKSNPLKRFATMPREPIAWRRNTGSYGYKYDYNIDYMCDFLFIVLEKWPNISVSWFHCLGSLISSSLSCPSCWMSPIYMQRCSLVHSR